MAITNKFVNDVQLAAKVDKVDGSGLISDSDKEQITANKNDITNLMNSNKTATAGLVWTATATGAEWAQVPNTMEEFTEAEIKGVFGIE